jgi:hypothetical protein
MEKMSLLWARILAPNLPVGVQGWEQLAGCQRPSAVVANGGRRRGFGVALSDMLRKMKTVFFSFFPFLSNRYGDLGPTQVTGWAAAGPTRSTGGFLLLFFLSLIFFFYFLPILLFLLSNSNLQYVLQEFN